MRLHCRVVPIETDSGDGPPRAAAASNVDDSVEYHALELGAGRSVVLLHDLYASHEAFDEAIELLARDWHVIVVDLPGHGRSTTSGDLADVADVAREMGAVLDEFGAFPAAVVGAGIGATVAVELAAERPDDVTALVLVGAGLGEESDMWTDPSVSEWLAGAGDSDDFVDAMMPVLYGAAFFVDQPGRAAGERARLSGLDPSEVAPLAHAVAVSGDRIARLADVVAPMLVIVGEDDAVVASKRVHEVAERAAAELVTLPRVGHSAVLEQPVGVGRLIGDFLRDR